MMIKTQLIEARKSLQWSQQILADKLGTTQNTISRWERGEITPGPYFRTKLCALFGKTAEELGLIVEAPSQGNGVELTSRLSLNEAEARQHLEASQAALAPHWSVPLSRNPFFTGREEVLLNLHEQLRPGKERTTAPSAALHGLGGIGKTQIALEYAYRYVQLYSAVFWVEAETIESINASFLRIAEHLALPAVQEGDHAQIMGAMQRWLENHQRWLLIWDNAEDLDLLQRFLPPRRQGSLLFTTRRQTLGILAQGIALSTMTLEEGVHFLLQRARQLPPQANSTQIEQLRKAQPHIFPIAGRLVTEMDALPLALDQAGAYIEETPCRLEDYLQLYQMKRAALLKRRGDAAIDHPASVGTTWSLSFEQLEHANATAADLLRLCAFLHPDAIPEDLLFREGTTLLGERLGSIFTDIFQLHEVFRAISAYSLIQRNIEERTLSMHRLVQVVLQENMSEQEREVWQRRALLLLYATFPEATEQSSRDRWRHAERLLPHVLSCAKAVSDQLEPESLAEVLHKTAEYLFTHAQYEQAEPLYQRALRIQERALGLDHPQTIATLNNLAILAFRQGKYAQAKEVYQQTLRLRERVLGPDHPQVASTLHSLAYTLFELGEYEHVEALYQRALHLREQALGPEHPDVAGTLNNLALFYYEQGKYEQAEPLYQRSLAIREQTLGAEHNQVAYPLVNLALLHYEQGKDTQAEWLARRALSLLEQALGPKHHRLIHPLNILALLATRRHRHEEAERLYQRALHILGDAVEAEHPDVAGILNNLGRLYAEWGRGEEAERLYQRALHIWDKALGPEHIYVASVLNNLADLLLTQGRDEEVEPSYQRALSLRKRYLGPEHPDTARSLASLGRLARQRGDYAQAEQFLQQACAIFEQRLGCIHPETIQAVQDLSSCAQKPENVAKVASARATPLHEAINTLSFGNDPLQMFLDTCCELHPRAWCRISDLWQTYERWAKEHQERFPLSRRAFAAQVRAQGCFTDRTNTTRIWRGITLVKQEL